MASAGAGAADRRSSTSATRAPKHRDGEGDRLDPEAEGEHGSGPEAVGGDEHRHDRGLAHAGAAGRDGEVAGHDHQAEDHRGGRGGEPEGGEQGREAQDAQADRAELDARGEDE